MANNVISEKSEILFLYESMYSIPNGDPFTSEQRFDDATKKILVSDVRIKRFIRDYLNLNGHNIFVLGGVSDDGSSISASAKFKELQSRFPQAKSAKQVILNCIDARLFGAVVTIKNAAMNKKKSEDNETTDSEKQEKAFNLTGPVQFAILNPSLNSVDLRMHQNTSVFSSSTEKSRGAIGTTTVVPYAINQIHGWINPFSAKETNLCDDDVNIMFEALWNSINIANTRTKQNQNSLLILQLVYSESKKKIYGADKLVRIKTNKSSEEQIRSTDDYEFDFEGLEEILNNDAINEVRYYTEYKGISTKLDLIKNPKMKKMENLWKGA